MPNYDEIVVKPYQGVTSAGRTIRDSHTLIAHSRDTIETSKEMMRVSREMRQIGKDVKKTESDKFTSAVLPESLPLLF